jgi:HAD superfamily hydrolase (TIGR01509 family)
MRKIPLLDLGNVVVKVNFEPFLFWLAERSAEKNLEKALENARRVLTSSLFYDFEFGSISPALFASRLRALYGAQFSQAELEAEFCGIFPGLVSGMGELMSELAAEGPVYALSNTNELHLAYLRAHFPPMSLFKHVFASHELGQRKPYPAIYQGVADALAVSPGELLFFDDVQANVEGALKAGLDAHLFGEAAQVRHQLQATKDLDDKT